MARIRSIKPGFFLDEDIKVISKKTIRFVVSYHLWRKAVLERDNYTCQHCGDFGNEAHHKKSYINNPTIRFAIDNGLTLCKKCHKKIPKERRSYASR